MTLTDPTVGLGAVLGTTARVLQSLGHVVHAKGIDIDRRASEIALKHIKPYASTATTQVANFLTDDSIEMGQTDLVVSEPPWGVNWDAERGAIEGRTKAGWYKFGLGSARDSTWLFAQRAIDLLRPEDAGGGRAIMLVTRSALVDDAGRKIRGALRAHDLLEAVVRLPEGLAANTGIPLYLLMLRRGKPDSMRAKSHVIDLQPFLTTQARGARRSIRPEGLRVLWSALEFLRPGPNNRIVDLSAFSWRTVQVTRAGSPGSIAWRLVVASNNADRQVHRRYGPIAMNTISIGDEHTDFAVDRIFSDDQFLRRPPWSATTRLSAMLAAEPTLSTSNDEPLEAGGAIVWLPTARGEASTTTSSHEGRILRLSLDPDLVHPDFLAGWLNSEQGQQSRRAAIDRASAGAVIRAVRSNRLSLLRLMDELVVPIPPIEEQLRISEASQSLSRIQNVLTQARSDLWTDPSRADVVVGPFEPLLDQSLERWTASLPYPFASALWTLASRSSVEAQHRQMFHTWESYAVFLATVLLSVLQQDPGLAEIEGPSIRKALDNAGLSLERATIGTWSAIVERLSSRFRSMLESPDDDERARLKQLFAGATPGVIEAIVSPECVRLLKDVNSKRNAWSGHAGATTQHTLQSQIDYLTSALEELRAVVGNAWDRLPLVRAAGARRRGGEYLQDVELVMGTSVPFRPDQLRVGEMMQEGELHLATDGCAEPVPLNHLVVLRSSHPDQRYSCYFYNRSDAQNARFVSYQMTEFGEIEEPMADLGLQLPWLLGEPGTPNTT